MAPLLTFRRVPRLIIALGLALVLAVPTALAQRGDPIFTVGGVQIDVAGPDPVKARERALPEAEKKALSLLIRRLVAEADVEKLPPLEPAQIEAMVSGFEIENERPSVNRYVATLRIAFVPDQIRSYLGGAGVAFVDRMATPVLVVPLVRSKLGVSPLEDHTEWREAWTRVSAVDGIVPMTLIKADQPDLDTMSPEQAFVGDMAAIAKLAERYQARRVLVVIATGEPEGPYTISAALYDLTIGDRFDQPQVNGVAATKLLEAAVRLRTRIEEDYKAIAAVSRDGASAVEAVVPIKALADWIKTRKRLQNSPIIRRVDVRALESEQAYVRIEHFGTREQFEKALGQLKLALREQDGQYVIVER
ncbi:MAG: DUF2066 domain-containing protein [Alphaproteobacteria bacterium]|nr:DUF2066 domain-containing protein [Alphaproteobacteria bacterium]MCW5739143.1 DUF2066 domain-containing protein [Alphaproteobacteria bacterium]